MATRRMNPYAKAYVYGPNRNVTKADGVHVSGKPRQKPSTSARARIGLRIPVWVCILTIAAAIFIQACIALTLRSNTTQAQKNINQLKVQLASVHEIIDSLEVNLAKADEPSRIHSIAVNRLGMQLPTPDQIQVMPRPQIPYELSKQESAAPKEGGGIIRLLLSMVGL